MESSPLLTDSQTTQQNDYSGSFPAKATGPRLKKQTPRRNYTSDLPVSLEQGAQQKTLPHSQRNLYVRFTLLCITMFIFFLTSSIFAPFFPQAAAAKGMSPFLVGFVFSTYYISSAILMPITTSIVIHIGTRFMIFWGAVTTAVATLLYALLQWCPSGVTFSIFAILLRIFQAIGNAGVQTVVLMLGATWFEGSIGFVYGIIESTVALGSMLGASLGGILYDAAGFYLPFLVTGSTLLFFGVPIAFFSTPKENKMAGENQSIDKLGIFKVLAIPDVWPSLIILFISALGNRGIEPIISPALQEAGMQTYTDVSTIILFGSAAYGVSAVFVSKLSDHVSKPILVSTAACVPYILGFSLQGRIFWFSSLPDTMTVLIAGYIVAMIGCSGIMAMQGKVMKEACVLGGRPDDMATNANIAGLFNTSYFIGGIVGPLVSSALVDSYGWSTTMGMFTILGGVALIMTLLSLFMEMRQQKKQPEASETGGKPTFSRQNSRFAESVVYTSTVGIIASASQRTDKPAGDWMEL